jgi:hypothetical protein
MQQCLRRRRNYRLLSLQRLVRGLVYDTCGIETEAGDERDTQQKRNQTARTIPTHLLLIRSDDMEADRSALGCCIVVEYQQGGGYEYCHGMGRLQGLIPRARRRTGGGCMMCRT